LYVTSSDDEIVRQETIEGKLFLGTFHSIKGLERKVVIVVAVDEFYLKQAANTNYNINYLAPLYVACTRA
jgi:superfamily I DNA/RNA helicase